MDERVEAYVDGDLSPAERARFESGLRLHALWRARAEQARALRDELHALPRLTCPPRVAEAVRAEVRRQQRTGRSERAPQRWLRLRQPAAWSSAVAIALLLAMVFAVLLRSPEPPPSPVPTSSSAPPFTDAEVEQATAEVAWTLAYLARIGEETGQAVEDVLPHSQLVRSTRRALEPVLGTPSDPNDSSR